MCVCVYRVSKVSVEHQLYQLNDDRKCALTNNLNYSIRAFFFSFVPFALLAVFCAAPQQPPFGAAVVLTPNYISWVALFRCVFIALVHHPFPCAHNSSFPLLPTSIAIITSFATYVHIIGTFYVSVFLMHSGCGAFVMQRIWFVFVGHMGYKDVVQAKEKDPFTASYIQYEMCTICMGISLAFDRLCRFHSSCCCCCFFCFCRPQLAPFVNVHKLCETEAAAATATVNPYTT